MLALVGGSQTKADVFKGFVAVESGVEVPLLVEVLGQAIVEVEFEVVRGLDFGVEGATGGKREPELDLIGDGPADLFILDGGLEIEGAPVALGVDLEGGELVMDEVVVDDGVGIPGEVGPGVDLDALGLGHLISTKIKS